MSGKSANGNGYGAASSGKRKRDEDAPLGAPRGKESKLKAREEEVEREFAAAYHGLTAMYKLLELQHVKAPLFLPRTLSFRRALPKAERGSTRAARSSTRAAEEVVGARLSELKVGMATDTIAFFQRQQQRVGLLFSVYCASGRSFAENSWELLASCLVPVPCARAAALPKQFVRADRDLFVVVVQGVQLGNDQVDELTARSSIEFVAASAASVRGADLLSAKVDGHEPLFANMIRLDVLRRRKGIHSLELTPLGEVEGVVKVQFRVVWDPFVSTSRKTRLASILATKWADSTTRSAVEEVSDVLQTPHHLAPSSYQRRENGLGVWFHFLYHKLMRQMLEHRPGYSCVFCNMFAGSLRGLVAHLLSSHGRFRYNVQAGMDNVPHIYVMPHTPRSSRKSEDGRMRLSPALCELQLDESDEADSIEHDFTHCSSSKYGRYGNFYIDDLVPQLDDFEALARDADSFKREFYAPLQQRQYFHSRTGAVVLDHEKDYDSDDDVDEEWITQQSERLLDEFEDVSLEEKEFMKKWNRHVKEYRVLADFMVSSSCRLFARLHGKWILDMGLRHNFLLHLFNLWDNSLIDHNAIIDTMLIVDHHAELPELPAVLPADAKTLVKEDAQA